MPKKIDSFPNQLTIDDITFNSDGLPNYPSLFGGIPKPHPQIEPALKARIHDPGSFEVCFKLADDGQTVFVTEPDPEHAEGRFLLRRINGREIHGEGWRAAVEDQGSTCRIQWQRSEAAPSQVLRLDCFRTGDRRLLHLFLAIVRPQRPPVRFELPRSAPGPRSHDFRLILLDGEEAPALPGARPDALGHGYGIEPAFRLRTGISLQVDLELEESSPYEFEAADSSEGKMMTQDQVPVRILHGSGASACLLPTERASAKNCYFTFRRDPGDAPLEQGFFSFNVLVERRRGNLVIRHGVDPTIIEFPYVPPPDGDGGRG